MAEHHIGKAAGILKETAKAFEKSETALWKANELFSAINRAYGESPEFRRELQLEAHLEEIEGFRDFKKSVYQRICLN